MIIEVVGKEIEKIKGDFESYLNGLNMVGEISYSQYSELYDEGTKQIQRAYELGKSELEKENAELKELFADCDTCKRTCDIGNCCKFGSDYLPDVEKVLKEQKQLTKAKEIIKTFLGFAEAFGYSPSMDKFIAEAEQFLKDSEVEK